METEYRSDYSQGRLDGTTAFVDFGPHIADEMVIFLGTLDKSSAYALGFAKSVNEAITDSLA